MEGRFTESDVHKFYAKKCQYSTVENTTSTVKVSHLIWPSAGSTRTDVIEVTNIKP
jgi:hypothetical protein